MRASRSSRRRLLALVGATVLLASMAAWQAGGAAAAANVVLTPVVGGLDAPVYLTSARDGTGRLFVVEQTGKIKIIQGSSVVGTFLDVGSEISHGSEQGLLGLAFHPQFKTNGLFFVNFTRANGDTVVNRYRVSGTNPNVALRSSALRIITIGQPYDNHNGGTLQFGPDGYLYIGMGDGGSGGDPGNRAQDVTTLLGKMLRIDINGSVGSRHYRIPSSNPYVGRHGRNEIWARGLRNPWKYSFDRKTGTLWIGDVGQNRYEEIDRSGRQRARAGRQLRLAGARGAPLLQAGQRLQPDRQDDAGRRVQPQRGLLGDRRLRLPRLECPRAVRPLCFRRLLLRNDLVDPAQAGVLGDQVARAEHLDEHQLIRGERLERAVRRRSRRHDLPLRRPVAGAPERRVRRRRRPRPPAGARRRPRA